MGLDTSHDCWSGAYSAFMRWRCEIAKCIGIPLQLMEGFYGHCNITWEDLEKLKCSGAVNTDGTFAQWAADLHRAVVGAPLPLKWDAFKPSALHILLNHSDCDGEIRWEDCGPIADELEKVLPLLPQGEGGGHIGDWRVKTQAFIDGLRKASAAKENVEFH